MTSKLLHIYAVGRSGRPPRTRVWRRVFSARFAATPIDQGVLDFRSQSGRILSFPRHRTPWVSVQFQGAVSKLQRHTSGAAAAFSGDAREGRAGRQGRWPHTRGEGSVNSFIARRSSDAIRHCPGRLTDDLFQFVPNS